MRCSLLVLALGLRDARVQVDASGHLDLAGLTPEDAAAVSQAVPAVVRKFDQVSESLDGLKEKLAKNFAKFEEVAQSEEANPSSLMEEDPGKSIDAQFAAIRAKVKQEMEDFKAKVDAEIDMKTPASLLQTEPQIKAEAKLQALEARLRAQLQAYSEMSSLLEVGPEDEDADQEEDAEDKADDKAADQIADEDGPETDAEKAETTAEEKTVEEQEEAWKAELAKDKDQQDEMMAKIKKIAKVDKPPKEMSRQDMAHLGDKLANVKRDAHPSSFVETEKHMRSVYGSSEFTWSNLPKTYHTFAQMLQDVDLLKEPCLEAGFKLDRKTVTGKAGSALPDRPVVLETVTLTPTAPKRKAAAVFGEHPRELISPETGLTMLQALCGQPPTCSDCPSPQANLRDLEKAAAGQAQTQWLIVLNSNPLTREKIETTNDFCLRLDPEGVDTNRNYDDHFYDTVGGDAQTHGSAPFSAPEVAALNGVLSDFRPDTFFSIHSGEKGLYVPHAWSTEYDTKLPEAVALSKVSPGLIPEDYDIGSAGELQGRPITGSSFDYVKDKLGAKYSYAFELYKNANVQPYSAETCFTYFNPTSVQQYTEVTRRMAAIILETAANSK